MRLDLHAIGALQPRHRAPRDLQLLLQRLGQLLRRLALRLADTAGGGRVAARVGDRLAQLVVHAAQLLDRHAHVAHGPRMSSGRIFCSARDTR